MTMNKPKLNGFEFLECLGRGAFGEVWLARDLTLNALRAIKIVAPDRFREQDVRRLSAEAQALAQLPHHRNRVVVHQIKDAPHNCERHDAQHVTRASRLDATARRSTMFRCPE